MTHYALLGMVQGVTEFLPVSSSGHLVLAQWLLGWTQPGVVLEAVVHLATLLAVLLYFRTDIWSLARALLLGGSEGRRYVGLIVLGTVPVALVGVLTRGAIEEAFDAPWLVGAMLLVTAAGLVLADVRAVNARRPRPSPAGALLVGLGQALSLLPGVSRSGATISVGVASGVRLPEAARFSFILSIPAILGAGVWEVFLEPTRPTLTAAQTWGMVVAGAAALVSGLIAIRLLLAVVRRRRLRWFALYCALVGIAVIFGSAF